MICSNLLVFLRHDFTALLSTDSHFDKCLTDIILDYIIPVFLGGINRCLVQKILQIGTGKAGRCLSDLLQIHVIAERLIAGMHAKYLFTSANIRKTNRYLSVKTAGSQNSRIQYIHSVRSCQYDNTFIDSESVHLHEKLIQCLLTFIVTAAETGTSASRNSVDLIDKYDARMIFLGILKEISHAGCTDADEHFHEIRSGN